MALKKDKYNRPDLKIPVSLGVIMDGNGRWAKKRLLPRSAGHRAGGESLRELCKNCGNYGVKYVTVYAFSTENWSRPQDEVDALMKLFVEYFHKYDAELEKEGIRTNVTLIFSPSQAILPAKNGSLFISPFIGWKEANGEDCKEYIKNIVQIYKNYGYYGKTQIICAALRTPKQIADCAVAGADIVTCGLAVFQDCMKHAYTNQGLKTFCEAWDNTVTE